MTTRIDHRPTEATAPHAAPEARARAARYLDLWERNVGLACTQGTVPSPPLPAPPADPAEE